MSGDIELAILAAILTWFGVIGVWCWIIFRGK